jgi:hypothetical protein
VTALTHRGGSHADRLQLAKQRLLEFDHIFLTDTLSEDMKTLERYGWQHLEVPWKNAPAGAENAAGWSIAREALRDHPKLLEQLNAEHEIDLELYAFAKSLVSGSGSGSPRPKRVPLSDREMPGGDNFEFLLFCAYEAFLKNDRPGCLALLHRAGRLPAAAEIFDGPSEDFVEHTLERFGSPKRVERERRQKRRRKGSAIAATSA